MNDSKTEAYEAALNPYRWTKEMSDAWHQNIPDIYKAFEALRAAALKEQSDREFFEELHEEWKW